MPISIRISGDDAEVLALSRKIEDRVEVSKVWWSPLSVNGAPAQGVLVGIFFAVIGIYLFYAPNDAPGIVDSSRSNYFEYLGFIFPIPFFAYLFRRKIFPIGVFIFGAGKKEFEKIVFLQKFLLGVAVALLGGLAVNTIFL